MNAVDRFGGTPLQDAFAARRKDIASYLRQSGGRLGDSIDGFFFLFLFLFLFFCFFVFCFIFFFCFF